MKRKQLLIAAFAILTTSAMIAACNKGTSTENGLPASQQSVSLYLTDGPGVFNNVFLDIKSVEILVDTAKNTRYSIFNLEYAKF